jgi:4,5-dihydroxyphthalate decarboxylase
VGKLQHRSIVYNNAFGELSPKDIEDRKVGIRAYTQTTGLWVRGVLQHEYGVDLSRVTWVTVEDPHVASAQDPDNCLRLPENTSLIQMLTDGEIAAAILGYGIPDSPNIHTLIPNADDVARAWYSRDGIWPINHMLAIHKDVCRQRPDAVREIYRMMGKARNLAPEAAALLPPMGLKANRKALETAIDWSYEQKIIPRRMSVDELFDDVTGNLD